MEAHYIIRWYLMAKLDIVKYPDPLLKQVSKEVKPDEIDDTFRRTIADMFETMYAEQGVGLAAIQVGIVKRFFVMDTETNGSNRHVLINPQIIEKHDEVYENEGCLSFPGIVAKVKRAQSVKVAALDEYGQSYETSASGFMARCIQHEFDHLNGVTFFDHLTPLKRKMLEKKYRKYESRAKASA